MTETGNNQENPVTKLTEIITRLRSDKGCPWDRLQTAESLKPYLLEETHEVLEALDCGNPDEIKKELGDLLLQIVFLADIFKDAGQFDFNDVANAISSKMVRRHPHVFGSSGERDIKKLNQQWEEIKKSEESDSSRSTLDSIPRNLPALQSARKLSDKVGAIGFDWPELDDVQQQLKAEMTELQEAIVRGDQIEIEHEFGDVLFTMVNLGRHLKVDSETALRKMTQRFRQRYATMEKLARDTGKNINQLDLDQLNNFWQQAKQISLDKQ